MNKYIFLDVDGVLNRSNPDKPDSFLWDYTHISLSRLRHVIDSTQAKIVLSSNWRHGYGDPRRPSSYFLDGLLTGNGLSIHSMTEWTVPNYVSRGRQIQNWLDNNQCDGYVIIDDIDDFLPEQQDRVILTDPTLGFNPMNEAEAISILNLNA